MSLRVLRPGLFTTVQDLGRTGHQRQGVPVSGAMDDIALRVANLLVGNAPGAAALELTLVGPTLAFERGALVALGGADLGARVDGLALPPWRPAWVPAGGELAFGPARSGCRACLAVAGGINVPPVMGSRSTFVRGGFGGHEGRALRRGDRISLGTVTPLAERIAAGFVRDPARAACAGWAAGRALRPPYGPAPVVRVVPGRHAGALTERSAARFAGDAFVVSPQSDRMGYRLDGPTLELTRPLELLSEAVSFGTVQLPPAGSPIVLMADRQTTGGYPRIGEVATVDLPLLAQLRPGDSLRFQPVSVAAAQALYLARERAIAEAALAMTLRHG